MSRIFKVVSAVSLGALLMLGSANASAGLLGSTVHAVFYGLTPDTIDDDEGTFSIATNGTAFTFTDPYYGFGTFMTVTFTDSQIFLTNLVPGEYPEYTAANFEFLSGVSIGSVTVDPASSPLFAPGSTLSFSSQDILVDLSNTCSECSAGESIVLDVTPVPEPSTFVLLAGGLLAMAWRRQKRSS